MGEARGHLEFTCPRRCQSGSGASGSRSPSCRSLPGGHSRDTRGHRWPAVTHPAALRPWYPPPIPRQAPRRPQARTRVSAGCTEVPVGQTWVLVLVAGVSSSRLHVASPPRWGHRCSGGAGRRRDGVVGERLLFEAILACGERQESFLLSLENSLLREGLWLHLRLAEPFRAGGVLPREGALSLSLSPERPERPSRVDWDRHEPS